MTNLTIRTRLLLLGFIAILGIVVSGCVGIVQLSRFNATLEDNFADIGRGIQTLIDIESAGVDFKIQIQEFKNVLIRGNDKDEFAKY